MCFAQAAASPSRHASVANVGRRRLSVAYEADADARLAQHPGTVELAGGLDDPREHQLPEHLVPAGGLLEPQDPVGVLERVDQMRHP